MSRAMVVELMVVGTAKTREPNDLTPPNWGVQMPIGGEIIGVAFGSPGPGKPDTLMAICTGAPNAPRVFTHIHILALGQVAKPLIGRKIGKLVGSTSGPDGMPIFVFLDEKAGPGLLGMEAEGNG
jgi:hypothetical protein